MLVLNWATSWFRASAFPASAWAEAEISWADADVSSVEADS
jgi:hypothetical protein